VNRSAIARAIPLAIVSLAGSCTDVVTNPAIAVAISFDTLPYPSVVAGDTLRDSLGRAAPMRAIAFNSSGGVIASAPIRYIAIDTGITIAPTGIVTAQARTGKIRIVASVNGLQSIVETLTVARQPNAVVPVAPLTDTLFYAPLDNPGTNVSCPLTVRVTTADTAGGVPATQGWVVSYQAFHDGQPLVQSDTTLATVWDDLSSNATLVDTTIVDGTAARRVRVRSLGLSVSPTDSVIVMATVRYRGANLPGSPIRFVVYATPKIGTGPAGPVCTALPTG
jgi:hypothetical protein